MPSIEPPRSFTTTLAPWAASSSACSRPMPLPAPVTMQIRPSQSLAMAPDPSERVPRRVHVDGPGRARTFETLPRHVHRARRLPRWGLIAIVTPAALLAALVLAWAVDTAVGRRRRSQRRDRRPSRRWRRARRARGRRSRATPTTWRPRSVRIEAPERHLRHHGGRARPGRRRRCHRRAALDAGRGFVLGPAVRVGGVVRLAARGRAGAHRRRGADGRHGHRPRGRGADPAHRAHLRAGRRRPGGRSWPACRARASTRADVAAALPGAALDAEIGSDAPIVIDVAPVPDPAGDGRRGRAGGRRRRQRHDRRRRCR